jgi:hypothetical protein
MPLPCLCHAFAMPLPMAPRAALPTPIADRSRSLALSPVPQHCAAEWRIGAASNRTPA